MVRKPICFLPFGLGHAPPCKKKNIATVNEDGFDGSLDTKAQKARCWPMHATKATWKVCPLSMIIGFIIEKQILALR